MVDTKWDAAVADPELLDRELYLSRRVRTPKRHTKRQALSGFYSFSRNGDHVWHESINESKVLRNLDHRGDILAIGSQPATMVFSNGNWHVLDFIAFTDTGNQIVFDVKLERDLVKPDVQMQLQSTLQVCELVGWGYEVHVELPVQHEQNMEWLEQFKLSRLAPPVDAVDHLLEVMQSTPSMSVIDAARTLSPASDQRGRTWMYHLVWTRALEMDLTAPLNDAANVWVGAA